MSPRVWKILSEPVRMKCCGGLQDLPGKSPEAKEQLGFPCLAGGHYSS